MDTGAWQDLGNRWIESWLAGMSTTPYVDGLAFASAKLFTDAVNAALENTGKNPAIHFKRFAELVHTYSAWYLRAHQEQASIGPAIRTLVNELQRQVQALRMAMAVPYPPAEAWLAGHPGPVLGPARQLNRHWIHIAAQVGDAVRAAHALRCAHLDALSLALARIADGFDADDGRELRSLRALYDWWVECADAAYRETAGQDKYARELGNVVNAISGAAKAWRDSMQDFTESMA